MSDPWMVQNLVKNNELNTESDNKTLDDNCVEKTASGFEDNFSPPTAAAAAAPVVEQLDNWTGEGETKNNSNPHQPLPDSESYLLGLECKLKKIKKGSKLVEALTEKRNDCLRNLLNDDSAVATPIDNAILELDTPISNGESTVQEIYRHLQPVQPVTVGETVHIVKYDQLEEQHLDTDDNNSDEIDASAIR